jgi:hypothetical protein
MPQYQVVVTWLSMNRMAITLLVSVWTSVVHAGLRDPLVCYHCSLFPFAEVRPSWGNPVFFLNFYLFFLISQFVSELFLVFFFLSFEQKDLQFLPECPMFFCDSLDYLCSHHEALASLPCLLPGPAGLYYGR